MVYDLFLVVFDFHHYQFYIIFILYTSPDVVYALLARPNSGIYAAIALFSKSSLSTSISFNDYI